VNSVCLILVVALLFGTIPFSESNAVPPRSQLTVPEHSGGGDDDDPLSTALYDLSDETPSSIQPHHEIRLSDPPLVRRQPKQNLVNRIKTRIHSILALSMKR
jgi:hypothetical protein